MKQQISRMFGVISWIAAVGPILIWTSRIYGAQAHSSVAQSWSVGALVIGIIAILAGALIYLYVRYTSGIWRKSDEIQQAMEQYDFLVDITPVGIMIVNSKGEITYVNEVIESMFGIEREKIIGLDHNAPTLQFGDIDGNPLPDEALPFARVMATNAPIHNIQMSVFTQRDQRFFVSVNAAPMEDAQGNPTGMIAAWSDITQTISNQRQIEKLSRIYAVLSDINQLIVRVRDQESLMEESCRIIVDQGNYRMAWIGKIDRATQKVEVIASAGHTGDYVEYLNIDLNDEQLGGGPAGLAVTKNQHIVCNNIADDPRMKPWRDRALANGYRSSASFPVTVEEKKWGTLNLYSTEVGVFSEAEMKLLDELTADLSFALESLQNEQARQEAEERLRQVWEHSKDGMRIVNRDGIIQKVNKAFCDIMDMSREDLVGQPMSVTYQKDPDYIIQKHIERFENRTIPEHLERKLELHNGEVRWFELTNSYIRVGDQEEEVLAIFRDITARKNAEEQLTVSEERFRSLYENTTIGVYRTTPEGEILLANPTLVKMLGFDSFDELSARNLKSMGFGPTYLREEFLAEMESKGEVRGIEAEWVRKDGSTIYVRESARAIRDDQGDIQYFDGTVEDITDRKIAEEELHESQRQLATLMSNLPGMAYRCLNEPGWPMEFVSEGCRDLTGYSQEAFTANAEVEYGDLILPEDRDYIWNMVQKNVKANEPFNLTYRIKTADEKVKWVWEKGRAVYSGDGEVIALEGFINDITRAKETEDELRESEKRYRMLFQNNPQPMWVYDLETLEFLEVNEEAVQKYGYSRVEFAEMTLRDIRPEEDVEQLHEHLGAGRPARQDSGEWRHLLKDGSMITVEIHSHTIQYEGRNAVLVLANDITDRKQAEADLIRAQRMETLGQVAGGIAHDFNNVLATIGGAFEMVQLQVADDKKIKKYLEMTASAIEQAKSITNRLLTFTRTETPETKAVSLRQFLDEIKEITSHTLPKNVQVQITEHTEGDLVRVDRSQLQQVVLNMCINSAHAMPGGGVISLGISEPSSRTISQHIHKHPDQRYLCLTVSDTGEGIAPDNLDKVFEPFFTTKKTGEGTGLGLAVAHQIIQNHNGWIDVESVPGEGTTFYIGLPAVEEVAIPDEVHLETDNLQGAGEHILVVDDEARIRDVVEDFLKSCGYRVTTAENGHKGFDLYQSSPEKYDLLLTDLGLPGMSGIELTQKIMEINSDLKAIAMTGYIDKETENELSELGFVDVLRKPFRLSDVAKTIKDTLNN